jgi:hypothetical protein
MGNSRGEQKNRTTEKTEKTKKNNQKNRINRLKNYKKIPVRFGSVSVFKV